MNPAFNEHFRGQLELGSTRSPEKDRNHHLGGRSFYFFDFDDNIAYLSTPLVLFHKDSGEELFISSADWAQVQHQVGKPGPYQDFLIEYNDRKGSFRYFRDHGAEELMKLGRREQVFVEDVASALSLPDLQWKGPSWDCFYHATFNHRPVSLITARGHQPQTFELGIRRFVQKGYLPHEPNYLSIFPVSHPETRQNLGDVSFDWNTPRLKQAAIRASVERAFEIYGYSPHHRFGMSDDDPKNVQSIYEEMARLKSDYPEVSFFLIETSKGQFIKHEIFLSETRGEYFEKDSIVRQLDLFQEENSN
jgi:hypothetical protein